MIGFIATLPQINGFRHDIYVENEFSLAILQSDSGFGGKKRVDFAGKNDLLSNFEDLLASLDEIQAGFV